MSETIELTKEQLEHTILSVLATKSSAMGWDIEVAGEISDLLFPKETLADYPGGWKDGERGSFDGMWADVWFPDHQEFRLRVISAGNWDPNKGTALVYWPGNARNSAEDEVPCGNVKPRFDLQRAWTANGDPTGEIGSNV